MRKINYFIILTIMLLSFGIKVNAASYAVDDGSTSQNLTDLKKGFSSTPSLSVTGQGFVKVYGKSTCYASSQKCDYQYQTLNSNQAVEELLKNIKCTNGEKNITYTNNGSGGTAYGLNSSNLGAYTGRDPLTSDTTYYWSEDYYVTCTNNTSSSSSGQKILTISDSGSNNSSNNSTNNGNSSATTTTQAYNSSTTVDNSTTGVETYYIVLGIVAILCYSLMLIIKKYNKFKMN